MAMAIVVAPSYLELIRATYHSHPPSANAKPRVLYSLTQIKSRFAQAQNGTT